MAYLFLTNQGSILRKQNGRLTVYSGKEKLQEVPWEWIDSIFLFGNISLTPAVISFCLQEGIDIFLLSMSGNLKGRISAEDFRRTEVLYHQFQKLQDPGVKLYLSKKTVGAKINNSLVIASRWNSSKNLGAEREIDAIRDMRDRVENACNIDELRGLEGTAARFYYMVLGRNLPDTFSFTERNYYPPKDPVNAILSLGYTLLNNNVMSCLYASKCDVTLGYYHTPLRGRPALSLDLMEEFRSLIVDTLVLRLLNRGLIIRDDFEAKENTFVLKREALTRFFKAYSDKIHSKIYNPQDSTEISYLEVIAGEAKKIADFFIGSVSTYTPFAIR